MRLDQLKRNLLVLKARPSRMGKAEREVIVVSRGMLVVRILVFERK